MIAAILVHPAVSISLGAAVLAALWWYWAKLGSAHVPLSRRRLRRITTMLLLASIPLMVAGLSFITVASVEFIIAWALVLLLMLLIILGASLDALNSVRLQGREFDREVVEAAKELARAVKRRREDSPEDDSAEKDGEP